MFHRFALAVLTLVVAADYLRGQPPDAKPADSAAPRGSIVEDRAAKKLVEAGDARYDGDEMAKAVEIWKSVIERYPRSRVRFDAHMRIGNFYLLKDRSYDRARTHFEATAVEDNRDDDQRAEATLKTGVCFYHARNFGKCFQVMRDVIEKFPVFSVASARWSSSRLSSTAVASKCVRARSYERSLSR